MNKLPCLAIVAAIALSPAVVSAGNGNGKGKNSIQVQRVSPQQGIVVQGNAGHCPPGLAKKAVPCVPPGQVKNRYQIGDRIDRDYVWINDPYRYGLKRNGYYVRAGDYVYGIDPDTHKVLNLIGAVADILN
ncbi:hypothetical protein [Roseibium sp. RKSG952]|uniref:hypothetical protein n=1 Tax=Roseibium sp. RKSG952 TaxID=2529384 RepID=UPI0012BD1832|nr:hypothetical protein [Roseibium sp. RKSG952]MTI01618.1 hypothetical protein [Roseibium sp. RKSG952]